MSSDCILQIYGIKQARRMAGLFFYLIGNTIF